MYTNDVAGNSVISNASAAHNWTAAQKKAFGRGGHVTGWHRIGCGMPYRPNTWVHGDADGDAAGLAGADATFGSVDWTSSQAAAGWSFDGYDHKQDGTMPLNSEGLQEHTSAIYTGASNNYFDHMYSRDAEGSPKYYPIYWEMDQTHGPMLQANSTGGMGYLDDLPDSVWIFNHIGKGQGSARTVATAGWSSNGSYLNANTWTVEEEDTNADSDVLDTGEAASTVVNQGGDHLCEYDMYISLHKRGVK